MGNETSSPLGQLFSFMTTSETIPVGELDSLHDQIRAKWHDPQSNHYINNEGKSTMERKTVRKAMKKIFLYFKTSHICPQILEVGSGNGIASAMLQKRIVKLRGHLIATDIYNYTKTAIPLIVCDCEEAIQKYGINCNCLLLFSPPPTPLSDIKRYNDSTITQKNGFRKSGNFMDYFAIKMWTHLCSQMNHQTDSPKYLIFFGELGASDGTSGMFNYLLTHPNWTLQKRSEIYRCLDCFGGICTKELFIFIYQNTN